LKTSYFAKYKENNGICIALKKPEYFQGESYPNLFPTWEIIKIYKYHHYKDYKEKYVYEYQKQILSKLNPNKVYDDLKDRVLLCYEKSGEFCHRRIVAAWIERYTGHKVEEIKTIDKRSGLIEI